MTTEQVTVRMSETWLWLIRVGGAALGFGSGIAAAPLVRWLVDLTGDAPGPLRLAAQLPTVWAVPVLTVVGAAAGVWAAGAARRDSPAVTVDPDHITVHERASALQVGRERIGAVFTDGRDFVVLDPAGGEVVRVRSTDLPSDRSHAAFERFGYPWRGTADPRRTEFVRWVDGTPDLDPNAHALLRARKRAMADKQAGAAADALDKLRPMGVAVRDHDGTQQYRHVREGSGAQQTNVITRQGAGGFDPDLPTRCATASAGSSTC